MTSFEAKTQALAKFTLPCSLEFTEWTVLDQFEVTEELASYAKRKLVRGMSRDLANLNAVAKYVGLKLTARDGGSWICVIEPFDIETGWMLNCTEKGFVVTFTRAKLKYIVFMYRLKVY